MPRVISQGAGLPGSLITQGYQRNSAPSTSGLFEQELAYRLATNSVIADLTDGRIYPVKLPQTADTASGPSITYRVVESRNMHNLDGPNGIVEARVEFRAFSREYSDVRDLKEQFRQMFDGFTGLLATSVMVIGTTQQADPDQYEQPDDGSDDGTHEVLSDYLFRYRVSIPPL